MPHAVEIVRRVGGGLADRDVRAAVRATLKALSEMKTGRPHGSPAERGAVSVTFVGDATMRALNRRTRRKNAATDVLSFPGGTDASFPAPGAPFFLGDVVISVPYARRDAKRLGIGLRHELFDLLVHGLLHCAGMDHVTASGATRMFALQERIVSSLCSR